MSFSVLHPLHVETLGFKTRIGPPYPHASRNLRRLKLAISRNNRKKIGPVSVLGRAR